MPETLPIIYRDDRLVVIDKPAGLLVHRSDLDRHETRFAVQLLRDQLGQMVWPVHRLDRGTSGLLVFALERSAHLALSAQFAQGEVRKTYLAVVRGHPLESGVIDHPLQRQRDDRAWRGDAMSSEPQSACTHYRRCATIELPVCVDRYPHSRYALLELNPLTGRQHQLRRHLKHIAHPIIGDATYGKGIHNRYFAQALHCPRLLLAATQLNFRHPDDGKTLSLRAPLNGDFAALMTRFDWSDPT